MIFESVEGKQSQIMGEIPRTKDSSKSLQLRPAADELGTLNGQQLRTLSEVDSVSNSSSSSSDSRARESLALPSFINEGNFRQEPSNDESLVSSKSAEGAELVRCMNQMLEQGDIAEYQQIFNIVKAWQSKNQYERSLDNGIQCGSQSSGVIRPLTK